MSRIPAVALAFSGAMFAAPALAEESGHKLAVLVVVDQLASEYMSRWGSLLDGGLGALMKRGAYYPNGVHDQANTATGPGHATIITGTWPDVHGIVSNEWFDPKDGARVYCVQDPEVGASPRLMMATSIGDQLRALTGQRSKVIALAIKDRVAILTGGQSPNLAAWYDSKTGAFTAGRWYKGGGVLPAWLERLNATDSAEAARGNTWERLRGDLDYKALASRDDAPWEGLIGGLGRTFPRKLGEGASDEAWRDTYRGSPPLLDALFRAARSAVESEKLGRGPTPDLLVLGVSTLDFVGHYYGSTSQEALDVLLRIDRGLGELMRAVELQVGQGQTLWVVTGDHGVAIAPEAAEEMGIRAARVTGTPLQLIVAEALRPLAAKGKGQTAVSYIDAPLVYLTPTEPGVDRSALRRAAAQALRAHPTIIEAWSWEDVDRFHPPFREMYRRVLYPGREPDVLIRQRPYDLLDERYGSGTNHGSPYSYDTHVPIMLMGPGVRVERDPVTVPVTAIAPTMAAWFGIPPPSAATEQPLSAVLR